MLFIAICVSTAALTAGCNTADKSKASAGYKSAADAPSGDTAAAIQHNTKALELLKSGDVAAAESELKAALEADSFYAPAHNNLGSIYYQRGELYLAAWEFQYAARLNPADAKPHNNLAMVFYAANKSEKAMESFSKAYQLNPNDLEITASLAKLQIELNKPDNQTPILLKKLIEHSENTPLRNWAAQQLSEIEEGTKK